MLPATPVCPLFLSASCLFLFVSCTFAILSFSLPRVRCKGQSFLFRYREDRFFDPRCNCPRRFSTVFRESRLTFPAISLTSICFRRVYTYIRHSICSLTLPASSQNNGHSSVRGRAKEVDVFLPRRAKPSVARRQRRRKSRRDAETSCSEFILSLLLQSARRLSLRGAAVSPVGRQK